ncbi:hypothetical protein ACH4OY_08350 [Micromonospora rubida]|uniref:DUF4878 domain-containing protein n=1 Tax=Micromonospora rubida TaxID=2697657 RepID=A0ABW7SG74_9ACTN
MTQFARTWEDEPSLDGYKVTDTQVHTTTNGDTSAEVTIKTGNREKVINLVKEGGDWRVCGGLTGWPRRSGPCVDGLRPGP